MTARAFALDVPTAGDWLRLLLFAVCYFLLNRLYFQIPDQLFMDVIYHDGVVRECAAVLNLLLPGEQVAAVRNHLLSRHADLEIVRGCDSVGVLLLLTSAILVYRARLRRKLWGLLLGGLWVYLLNLARVVVLYLLVRGNAVWFEYVHVYFAPTLLTLAALWFFAGWAALPVSMRRPA